MEEINQEDLEHKDDHPVTTEIPEFDEEWIRKMYEQLNKATSIVWKEEQNKIWGSK